MSGPSADYVLPVDKPVGPTSHDVVRLTRKALGVKRIGHTGTLDPFASGLLLLCVGKATRLAEYVSGLDKTYEAVARLGVRTDTCDLDGEVVAEYDEWRGLEPEAIGLAVAGFRGEIAQVPPAYSAKKVGGERAYRRAREGKPVALEPCRVTIHSLKVVSVELPDIRVEVTCSSGTYVRALARDIGDALGVGAHLRELRRTAVGDWRVDGALPLDAVGEAARVAHHALTPLAAVRHLPTVEVDERAAGRLIRGQPVELAGELVAGAPLAVAHGGVLLAIGEVADGLLRPRKVFAA